MANAIGLNDNTDEITKVMEGSIKRIVIEMPKRLVKRLSTQFVTSFLSGLISCSGFANTAIAQSMSGNSAACPSIGNRTAIVVRNLEPVLAQEWKKILPPGTVWRECRLNGQVVVMLVFTSLNNANNHSQRVMREIIQPYYARQIQRAMSLDISIR